MENSTITNRIQIFLDGTLGKVATKLSSQKHINSLKSGMMFTLPFTLIGGFVMILMFLPIPSDLQPTNFFFSILLNAQAWGSSSVVLKTLYTLSLGLISVYTVFGISYSLAQEYKLKASYTSLTSLFVFLAIAVTVAPNETGLNSISINYLDASGMFVAIIVAMITVEVTRFLKKHDITIKLPESVPPMVSAPFELIIPLVINVFVVVGGNALLNMTVGFGFVDLLTNLLSPVLSASGSLPAVIMINLLVMLFWLFGIHGAALMAAIIGPLQTANLTENAAAVAAGDILPNVFAGSFKSIFATQIMYNALLIAVLLFASSPRLKSLCKFAFIPNFFNINEPLIFGLPIVMNVTLMIPILLTTIINTITSYLAMNFDLVGKIYIYFLPTFPAPINAFISTMDWKAPVMWLLLFLINLAIFYPFVRVYDKQVIEEDARLVKKSD